MKRHLHYMSRFRCWLFRNGRIIGIHAAVWVIYLFFNNLLLFFNSRHDISIGQMVFTYALVAIVFYTNVYGIVLPCVEKRRYGRLVLCTLLLLSGYVAARYTLFRYIFPALGIAFGYGRDYIMFERFLPDALWIFSQYLLFSYGYWFALRTVQLVRQNADARIKLMALERDKTRAELALLQAQLNPHLLYNTLNSFYADALTVSPGLADALMGLSQMLRSVTEIGLRPQIPVGQELDYIRHYLKLQRYRFDRQLYLQLTIEGSEYEHHLYIPPLIFIPLLENIFKYGDLHTAAFPARVNVRMSAEAVVFSAENKKNPVPNYYQGGLGLKNIEERLKILYRNDCSFEIREKKDTFYVRLALPARPVILYDQLLYT
jgi:two-component system, LytTR family, sensor kinase